MEPALGRRPPPSVGESATTVSPRFGRPVSAIGPVLRQAADDAADGADAKAGFRGRTAESGSVGDAFEGAALRGDPEWSYKFKDAETLIDDFFNEVESALRPRRVPVLE